ncbi:hypothetical protein V3C99_012051, partial [Haemonchus contortus]
VEAYSTRFDSMPFGENSSKYGKSKDYIMRKRSTQ